MSRTALSIVTFLTAATVSLGCGGETATPGGSTTTGMAGMPGPGRGGGGTGGGSAGTGGTMPPGPMGGGGTGKMMKPGMMGTGGHRRRHRHTDARLARHRLPGRRPQRHRRRSSPAARPAARTSARRRPAPAPPARTSTPDRHDQRFDLLLRTDHQHHDHHGLDAGRDHRIPARDGGRPGVLPLPDHLRSRVRRQHVRRQRDRLGARRATRSRISSAAITPSCRCSTGRRR